MAEEFLIDGEGGGGWRLDLLPTWLQRDLAPFTAERRAKRLSELQAALRWAEPRLDNSFALQIYLGEVAEEFGGELPEDAWHLHFQRGLTPREAAEAHRNALS